MQQIKRSRTVAARWTTAHTEADDFDAVAIWITRKTGEIVRIVFAEDPGRVQDFSERGAFTVCEADPLAVGVFGPQAEWLKDCLVERQAAGGVGHRQGDMINYAVKYHEAKT